MSIVQKLRGKVIPMGELGVPVQTTPLKLELIHEHAENVRTQFKKDEMEALQESIARHGLIFPLIVHPSPAGQGYELVDGHRRYRAISNLGWKLVDARIFARTLSKTEIIEVQRATDALHIAHSPYDLSRQCARLQKEAGSKKQAAEIMQLGSRAFEYYAEVGKLPSSLLERAEKRNIAFAHVSGAVRAAATKPITKAVGLSRPKIVAYLMEKAYTKAIPARDSLSVYQRIGRALKKVTTEEASVWLKNPQRSPDVLLATAEEVEDVAIDTVRGLARSLSQQRKKFGALRNAHGIDQITPRLMDQLADHIKEIRRECDLLRRRWNKQRGGEDAES